MFTNSSGFLNVLMMSFYFYSFNPYLVNNSALICLYFMKAVFTADLVLPKHVSVRFDIDAIVA